LQEQMIIETLKVIGGEGSANGQAALASVS
jgi:6-phosphofructokinase